MNLVRECPCCGSSIAEEGELRWDSTSRLLMGRGFVTQIPRVPARVFDALWKARPKFHPLSSEEMKSIVYANDPTGGPVTRNIISVHIVSLKKIIEPFGLTIQPYTGYLLVDLPRRVVTVRSPQRVAVSA